MQKTLGKVSASLGDFETSLGKVSASLGDFETSLGKVSASLGDFETSLGEFEKTLFTRVEALCPSGARNSRRITSHSRTETRPFNVNLTHGAAARFHGAGVCRPRQISVSSVVKT